MKITVDNGEKTTISLTGQLDTLSAVDFEKTVSQIIQGNTSHIIVDCAGLAYISSAGLRLLLTLQKGMKARNGSLTLKNVNSDIMDIFNITGFKSILTIE